MIILSITYEKDGKYSHTESESLIDCKTITEAAKVSGLNMENCSGNTKYSAWWRKEDPDAKGNILNLSLTKIDFFNSSSPPLSFDLFVPSEVNS